MMSLTQLTRALALSCHPMPTVAVTALGAGCAALAGLPLGRATLVAAAILAGQLSIGWSNDYLDAGRDRAVARPDKPVATGALPLRVAALAAVIALVIAALLSIALGWPGGAASFVIVVSGWAYNVGLKGSVWSWVPYAVAFGMLPAVATLSALPPRWPGAWALAAGALLGIAAHLANVLPDVNDDAATGVRGLPHRIGAQATALSAGGVLLAASAVILFGPSGDPVPWHWVAFTLASVVTLMIARLAFIDPASRRIFLAIIAVAALDLMSFWVSGVEL